MKFKLLLLMALLANIFVSCKKDFQDNNATKNFPLTNMLSDENNSGQTRIAVISDIHYMDPSLLQNNAQYELPFQNDRLYRHYALVEFSIPILNEVIKDLLYEKPDIVLIAGDLTKEGERVSHIGLIEHLQQLRDAGIKVYIVPGNCDINNPNAKAYNGTTTSPVPAITALEFENFYSNFGYGNALFKDPNSLSYIAEPFPGLWILGIDAAKYSPVYARSGRIKPETMQWIREKMEVASQNNIMVLGLMHHSLIGHFEGQKQILPGSIIDDWEIRADSLLSYGIKVICTGRTHANDITMRVSAGKSLYEIQTGSTVTPPSPYRLLTLKNKELEISTSYVTSIDATLPGNMSFPEYAHQDMSSLMEKFFRAGLELPPYSLQPSQVNFVAPLGSNAFMAFLEGDEKISPEEQQKIDSLNYMVPKPDYVIWALTNMWTDNGIKDNKWHIKLTDP